MKYRATIAAWFSIFLLKAFVRRVNRRIDIGIVILALDVARGDVLSGPQPIEEVVADKDYHSNQTMVDLDAVEIRSYIAEPEQWRRDWSKASEAQAPVYGNRRRIRGSRGRRLMRRRGETVERSFAHVHDTGGMRRPHLRGHTNILTRILSHVSGFNLGLILRQMIGVGTPRGLEDRPAVVIATLWVLMGAAQRRLAAIWAPVVWLAFAGGIAVVPLGVWGVIGAAGEGEWGAAFGALLIGGGGGWAFGTAWWKALRRMRGHRRRVQQARAALRQTGQLPEA